jgi:hypothetical protein
VAEQAMRVALASAGARLLETVLWPLRPATEWAGA